MEIGIAEKVFQYRHGNVWKQGFLSMFTQSHWIVYEGELTFYDAANKPVEDIDKATKLAFKFATWGKDPLKSSSLLKYGVITPECFKSTFYGYIVCYNTPTKQIKYNSNEKMSLCLNLLIVVFCMYKKAMQV